MRKFAVVPVLVLLAACGKGNSSPTSPSNSSSTSSVTLNVAGIVKVGESQQASATANLASGETRAVTTGFKSDTPTVATATDTGMVTGVSNGTANIFVVYGGQQGLRQVRVVPDYQGTWTGQYQVTACTSDGIVRDAGVCVSALTIGTTLPISAILTQSGDQVVGTFSLGSLATSQITVPVRSDGSVAASGDVSNTSSSRITATVVVNQVTPGQLTGIVAINWLATGGVPGSAQVTGSLVSGGKTHALPIRRTHGATMHELVAGLSLR
jgi:hypothetical protein